MLDEKLMDDGAEVKRDSAAEAVKPSEPAPVPSTQSTPQEAAESDPFEGLSPGFSRSIFDEKILSDNMDVLLVSCFLPCIPLGMMKARMEYREFAPLDCLLPPNAYQLRQQFRFHYLRPDTANRAVPDVPAKTDDDVMAKDCIVSCLCCFAPCAITQMVVEMASREGKAPSTYCGLE